MLYVQSISFPNAIREWSYLNTWCFHVKYPVSLEFLTHTHTQSQFVSINFFQAEREIFGKNDMIRSDDDSILEMRMSSGTMLKAMILSSRNSRLLRILRPLRRKRIMVTLLKSNCEGSTELSLSS